MATGAWPSLVDVADRMDGEGKIPVVAELLSQCNEFNTDLPYIEANEKTGHLFVFRTSIPAGSWRTYNQGVQAGKSTTGRSRVGMGMLADLSQIDRDLAKHTGNTDKFRDSENVAFLEGMSQTIVGTYLYGNTTVTPAEFMGLSSFYNTSSTAGGTQNAANVISGGGTGTSNTSLWLIGWGASTIYGIYPRGSTAGLETYDQGDSIPAYDNLGNPFRAYTMWFQQEAGLVPQDWRYGVRFANIDTTSAGLSGPNAVDLFASMAEMLLMFPKFTKATSGITTTDAPYDDTGVRAVFYCNRTTRHWMDIQMIRNRNVLLTIDDYDGKPTEGYRGIPIRVVDQILNNEAAI